LARELGKRGGNRADDDSKAPGCFANEAAAFRSASSGTHGASPLWMSVAGGKSTKAAGTYRETEPAPVRRRSTWTYERRTSEEGSSSTAIELEALHFDVEAGVSPRWKVRFRGWGARRDHGNGGQFTPAQETFVSRGKGDSGRALSRNNFSPSVTVSDFCRGHS
jgi:hypothetical protein